MLLSHQVQVNVPPGEGNFHYHLPNGQGKRQVVRQQILAKFESYLSEGQAGIQVFFKPCILLKEFCIFTLYSYLYSYDS